MNPKKISEFTILREGSGESGDLGMNFIDADMTLWLSRIKWGF